MRNRPSNRKRRKHLARKSRPRQSLKVGDSAESSADSSKQKTLLRTVTGEPLQLARVHYAVLDKERVEAVFSKLSCIDYDGENERWVWLFHGEAKSLRFGKSYRDIPIKLRPIVLGSFFRVSDAKMFLNVNSFARVWTAVEFFDALIGAAYAKVSEIEVVNRVFEYHGPNIPSHREFLDGQPIKKTGANTVVDEFRTLVDTASNPQERAELALSRLHAIMKQPLADLERFETTYYEEDRDISGLKSMLTMRTSIALHHWQGNTDFTFWDFLKGTGNS